MKQSKYIILLLLCCLFCSCAGQSGPYVLDVPDKVEVVKTDKHIRIKGTCIFIVPPEGYVQVSKKCALAYENTWYIFFVEYNNSLDSTMDLFLNDSTETGRSKYCKRFELGGNDAFIVNEKDALSIFLENQSGLISISGTYLLTEDRAWRDVLLESMLTAYIDTSYRAESMNDFAFFTVDLSGTDFKQAYYANGFYYYTLGGKKSHQNSGADGFIISVMPYDDAENIVEFGIKLDTDIQASNIRRTELNGYPAVEYYSDGVLAGKTVKMYTIVFGNGKTSLAFCGLVYNMEQYDKYMAEYKRLVKTIRFKEDI